MFCPPSHRTHLFHFRCEMSLKSRRKSRRRSPLNSSTQFKKITTYIAGGNVGIGSFEHEKGQVVDILGVRVTSCKRF